MSKVNVRDSTVYVFSVPTKWDFEETLVRCKGSYDLVLIRNKARSNSSDKPYTANGGYG